MISALRAPLMPQAPSPQPWFPITHEANGFGWTGGDLSRNTLTYNGNTYIGVIDGAGGVRVLSYNHASKTVTVSPVVVTGLTVDEHNSPAVLVRQSDQKILVAACEHTGAAMYVAVSSNAEDVSGWGAATDISSSVGAVNYTYPTLVQLSGESGKIYLFYRDQVNGADIAPAPLCYSTSTDGGATWSAETQVYEKSTAAKSYWAIDSDSTSRIDFVTSDGDGDLGDTASVYHFYYTGGSYHKTDGTLISTSLPLAPGDLTKIYDGATNGTARACYSMIGGSSPIAAWVAHDSGGTTKTYWYGIYTGGSWSVNDIDTSGSSIANPNFDEGGVCIDRTDINRVFTSKKVSGVWQILVHETSDGGSTWSSTQLTSDTEPNEMNIRPLSPKDAVASLPVVWRCGPDYFKSGVEPALGKIRGYPNPVSAF